MKKGFTLVELLIVMVVVAVMVTLAVPKYKVAMEKGRSLEGLHNAAAISDALNAFYIQDGNTYHSNRLQSAVDAAGTTQSKHFVCSTSATSSTATVLCKRMSGSNIVYTIGFTNTSGEINSRICSGHDKYCKALGATQAGNSGEWSFPY